MSKKEFLKKLREKLAILNATDVEKIILEFKEEIERLIENGMNEKKAVSSLGDIDEIAKEKIKEYTVHSNKEDHDIISELSEKIMYYAKKIVNVFEQKSTKEIVELIIEILLILLFVALCHLPISILEGLGKAVFSILSGPLNKFFYLIWNIILEISYFVLAALILAKIIDVRFLKEEVNSKLIKKNKKIKKVNQKENMERKSENLLVKILVIFTKFIAICLLCGGSAYLIGMGLILGLCLYLLIKGVTYFGFYLVMLALFILGVIFFNILFNFVLDKKIHFKKIVALILISFVILAFGGILATFEVATTSFTDKMPTDEKLEILTEELPYTDDIVFLGNISDYEMDNTLDNVIISYKYYPLGAKLRTNIHKDGNEVYLGYRYDGIVLSKEFLNEFINNLKEKKLYNFYIEPQIVLKANEKTIESIKEKRKIYYQNEPTHSTCEFVRTYKVEMVKPKNSKQSLVILSENNDDDMESITLDYKYANNLEEGKTYEFIFRTYQTYIDTDIDDVFRENEVIEVRKTDKVGINQRQDTSCSVFY